MILQPGPLFRAIESVRNDNTRIILTSPGGKLLNQEVVQYLNRLDDICIICGHYEGVDQRVIDRYVDEEISVGDYILSGGEYAALAIIDSVSRYIPGFMTNPDSLKEESFERGLLEYPQYTRPAEIDGMAVPDILLTGNHGRIEEWRKIKSLEKTKEARPDLYIRYLNNQNEE